VKEALSSALTAAGFSVLHEHDSIRDHLTVIIDIDHCNDPELMAAHRWNGDSIVVLASETDALKMDNDQIASLSGILTCDLSADAFVRSLRLICSGERVFPRGLAPRRRLSPSSPGNDGNRLSAREREVLSHLLAGHANEVIARHLGTTETTVKVYLKNLLRKIKVNDRTQAAIWALSNLPELGDIPRGFV
jgi:two-component system nitrate/nitrite response regulator NarL